MTYSRTHARTHLLRPRSTRRHAHHPRPRHSTVLALRVPCASQGKRTLYTLSPYCIPFSAPLLTLRLHLHRLHLPSLLRNYFVKPLLGAIWKQPLKPHHALDLEPDWVAHLAEEEVVLKEALQERMRLRYRYEAGIIPDVASHVTEMIVELQQARAWHAWVCVCACAWACACACACSMCV